MRWKTRRAISVSALDYGWLSMRIGLHAGATVGGVVGHKMLRYHLFGPPLEGVTKMEQACDIGGVRCSEQFAVKLRQRAPPNEFLVEAAGPVEMEDGIERMTYRLRRGTASYATSRRTRMFQSGEDSRPPSPSQSARLAPLLDPPSGSPQRSPGGTITDHSDRGRVPTSTG